MQTTKQNNFAFLGEGRALIDRVNEDGSPRGPQMQGNCQELRFRVHADLNRQISYLRDKPGALLATEGQFREPELQLVLDRVDSELFALAFAGQSQDFRQDSGTIKDMELRLYAEKWISCGKILISAPTLRNANSGFSYHLGEDFCLRARSGLLRATCGAALEADIIAAGEQGLLCVFSCEYEAIQSKKIIPEPDPPLLCRVLVEGRDRISGRHFLFRAERAQLLPDGEIALISDASTPLRLRGTILGESYDIVFM